MDAAVQHFKIFLHCSVKYFAPAKMQGFAAT
ncbi:MAG: hypothetical protein ACJAZ1_002184 [Yoonia sp.]|jgi:hypothetical protein